MIECLAWFSSHCLYFPEVITPTYMVVPSYWQYQTLPLLLVSLSWSYDLNIQLLLDFCLWIIYSLLKLILPTISLTDLFYLNFSWISCDVPQFVSPSFTIVLGYLLPGLLLFALILTLVVSTISSLYLPFSILIHCSELEFHHSSSKLFKLPPNQLPYFQSCSLKMHPLLSN